MPDGLSVDIDKIECHGGVTFNDHWSEFPTDGYYIGFDCIHHDDWDPFTASEGFSDSYETYKDTEFVLSEIKHIIKQLKEKQQ